MILLGFLAKKQLFLGEVGFQMASYGKLGTNWFNQERKRAVNVETFELFSKKSFFLTKKDLTFLWGKTAILSTDFVSTDCE